MTDIERPGLRRTLGPVALCLYGLGNILGAGIYVLVGEVAGSAGMLAPAAFLLAGGVAALSAFSYGELAARYPVSAGEAVWVQEGFGLRRLSMATGLFVATAGVTSSATLARGFAGYLQVIWPVPDAVVIVTVVLALGALAAWGVSQSVRAAGALTLVEAAGLVLVVAVAGAALLGDGVAASVEVPPMPDTSGWAAGLATGAFLAFFAFIGFEDMVNVAEEVRDPQRTIPRAIIGALAIATLLYMLVVTISVLTVPPAQLAAEGAPLAAVYRRAGGDVPWLLAAIGMAAVVNGVLVQVIMAARVVYGMARQGWLPGRLARVHPRTRTPVAATVLVTAIVMVLALAIDLGGLARITSFLVLLVFALVNIALMCIKRREPLVDGVRPVPLWLPGAAAISALALLAAALAGIAG